jgi:hypothetical protein
LILAHETHERKVRVKVKGGEERETGRERETGEDRGGAENAEILKS